MAKLYFRYGAMNCGKSTALIQVDYNYRERNMNTVIIKPETDTKGSDKVISRLNVERSADIIATGQRQFVSDDRKLAKGKRSGPQRAGGRSSIFDALPRWINCSKWR